ncbi:aspartate aminotransferase family protein [Dongia sedimenti]|uniref:Aspartate aminotransferase family protein n=1 Tax=Dongia sedimenti TaxID=3064282 RepID=A0ABU0YIH2_9PROT|nr:aspartate aminotransferase family protein [Rhodospirillaceae bacterium R-7]
MPIDINALVAERSAEKYDLYDRHLNSQMVKVLRTIGFDRHYVRGAGAYLYDREQNRYLDLLSGFGAFAVGRNHPTVIGALQQVLTAELPNLVQMDVSLLSGLLADRLLPKLHGLDKMFFCNSGAEAVEAAMKFCRAATGRDRLLFCDHAFHGLTYGALSLNGDDHFRDGFGSLLPQCSSIPFNDLMALDRALAAGDVAGFIVEPIQGKGVNIPDDDYLKEAARLCKRHGALFVVDEIQTGIGRTGRFLAIDHWEVEPDMVLLAKALSGGFVPVGAVGMKKQIFNKIFDRMDRAVVHGSTFAKTDIAMAAGLATLQVLEDENLVENAAVVGEGIKSDLAALIGRHEFVKAVRGKGLMIAIEFGAPKSLSLKAAWALLEQANKGLFCQLITIPLLKQHRIMSQVAGYGMNVIKLIPPLTLTQDDRAWIRRGFEQVVADSHRVPGAIWDLGRTLAAHSLKARSSAA